MEKQQKIELQDFTEKESKQAETLAKEYVAPKLTDHGTVQELTKTIPGPPGLDDGGGMGPVYTSGV